MLEIIALIILTRRIGAICEGKGRKAGWYKALSVLLWFLGEGAGMFIGIIAIGGSGFIIYLYALIGAIIGAGISFLIVKNLQPVGERDSEKANRAIKSAWIAATIVAGLTLISAVTGLFGLDLSALWIVIVVLGLAFGVYKRNRACAVILFVFWVFESISGIWLSVAQGQTALLIGQLPVRIVFAIFFFRGIRGTFAYHRIIKAERISEANSEIDTGGTGTAK